MKNIEVTFAPLDWNKECEKPWTIHWEDENGMDAGYEEFFASERRAEKRLKEIIKEK